MKNADRQHAPFPIRAPDHGEQTRPFNFVVRLAVDGDR
jgi:hypothetical protein